MSGARRIFETFWCFLCIVQCPARYHIFAEVHIFIDISHMKTKHINTKIYIFCLSSWGWITCNEQVLLIFLQSWASVVFTHITFKVSLIVSYFTTCFFGWWWRMLLLTYTSLQVKMFLLSFATPVGHCTMLFGAWLGITRCNHIQTLSSAHMMFDHARENS